MKERRKQTFKLSCTPLPSSSAVLLLPLASSQPGATTDNDNDNDNDNESLKRKQEKARGNQRTEDFRGNKEQPLRAAMKQENHENTKT